MKKGWYYVATFIVLVATPVFLYFEILLVQKILFLWNKGEFIIWGIASSFVINKFSTVLKRIYIFFHELAHAGAAVIFSANIFEFSVGVDSGYIKSDKNNIFIRLAPYLMPWQSYLVLFFHYGAAVYFRYYHNYFGLFPLSYFLVGIFFSSTVYYNTRLLLQETSDINREELMLSFLIIFNSFLFFSVLMLYLLFNSEIILDEIYFLPLAVTQ